MDTSQPRPFPTLRVEARKSLVDRNHAVALVFLRPSWSRLARASWIEMKYTFICYPPFSRSRLARASWIEIICLPASISVMAVEARKSLVDRNLVGRVTSGHRVCRG